MDQEELLERGEMALAQGQQAIVTAEAVTANITNIAHGLADAAVSYKQIEHDIAVMDMQFGSYLAGLEFQLEKYQVSAPIVREQLNNLDHKMERILDTVLELDTDDDRKLDFKLKLLDTLNNYSDKLSMMMVKLL